MNWSKRKVVVTGGAGFIGSNLVDSLLGRGADVLVVDKILVPQAKDSWMRKVSHLSEVYAKHGTAPNLEVLDIESERFRFQHLLKDIDAVFHLSAVFGGREFVEVRQSDCAKMFAIDHNAIEATYSAGVPRFFYASSACTYPPQLQTRDNAGYLLKEEDALSVGAGFEGSDNLYGWAKLMGELQCKVYHDEKGLRTSTCRFLTVYGVGEMDDSHAISALIDRTLNREEPFLVWGSGLQERGFTYVSDIVDGIVAASERVSDGTPVNLGTPKRYTIDEVVQTIFDIDGWHPKEVYHDLNKVEGPASRSYDISRAKRLLDWEPKVDLPEGLEETVAWHKRLRSLEAAPSLAT
jgi:nucleoside-diphosphate-sugar epimerase